MSQWTNGDVDVPIQQSLQQVNYGKPNCRYYVRTLIYNMKVILIKVTVPNTKIVFF